MRFYKYKSDRCKCLTAAVVQTAVMAATRLAAAARTLVLPPAPLPGKHSRLA